MSETRSIVVNVRLTPMVMAALTAKAVSERQPVRRMAALLIEDAVLVDPPVKFIAKVKE
jgi:hypothetical protein